MKDRMIPCEHYVCAGAECKKGRSEVTLAKCKNCQKYRPRKTGNAKCETITSKKNKIVDKEFRKIVKDY